MSVVLINLVVVAVVVVCCSVVPNGSLVGVVLSLVGVVLSLVGVVFLLVGRFDVLSSCCIVVLRSPGLVVDVGPDESAARLVVMTGFCVGIGLNVVSSSSS